MKNLEWKNFSLTWYLTGQISQNYTVFAFFWNCTIIPRLVSIFFFFFFQCRVYLSILNYTFECSCFFLPFKYKTIVFLFLFNFMFIKYNISYSLHFKIFKINLPFLGTQYLCGFYILNIVYFYSLHFQN